MSDPQLRNQILKWGALTLVAIAPLTLSRFWVGLASVILLYALAALGLAFVFAYGGILDVGHGIYFAAAAYTVVLASNNWPQVPLIAWIILGTGIAAVIGLAVRLVLYRVGGLYMALATLSLSVSAQALLEGSDWAGKFLGLTLTTRDLFGFGNVGPHLLYGLAATSTALALWLVTGIPKTHSGRIITTVRTVPTVAEAIGVDTARLELKVFVIGAVITGWAGGLFVVLVRIASPDLAGLGFSLELLIMNIVGGVMAAIGPLYGALVIRGLPEVIQQLRDWQTLLLGVFFLVVLVGFRGGIEQVVRQAADSVTRAFGVFMPTTRASQYNATAAGAHQQASTALKRPVQLKSSERSAEDHVVLELRALTKHFGGVVAADKVDLCLQASQLHALVGPNGSGKTTIIDMISGLTPPTSGEVLLLGEEVGQLSPSQRSALGLTRTFQIMKLSPDLTIAENIMIGAHLRSGSGLLKSFIPMLVDADEAAIRDVAMSTMKMLGIHSFADARPGAVPAGIQRLTEVGRCLVGNARVLLLDEPAAGLNEAEVAHLGSVLRAVVERDISVLLVEHNMDLVLEIADLVTVIDAGKVIASDAPERVVHQPEVIAAYLGRRHADAMALGKQAMRVANG